jgi:hypothetical protein
MRAMKDNGSIGMSDFAAAWQLRLEPGLCLTGGRTVDTGLSL